jgi:hypothetical protein
MVGGTRSRDFDGTRFEPRKVPQNVHAVLTDGSPTTPAPVIFRESGRPGAFSGVHYPDGLTGRIVRRRFLRHSAILCQARIRPGICRVPGKLLLAPHESRQH